MRVWPWEGFRAQVAFVTNLPECRDDSAVLHVPVSDWATVAVDKVDVANPFATGQQSVCDIRFFDVHVEQIA